HRTPFVGPNSSAIPIKWHAIASAFVGELSVRALMVRMGSERSSPGRKAFDLKEALDVFGARSNADLVPDGWEAWEIIPDARMLRQV
ncbi:unnamed protein product, partial [Musa hybrid cultivar]